jgi:hypothetical protein
MIQKFQYSKIKESDFYNFFNLSEKSMIGNLISLKPGGFQKHIDFLFKVENDLIYEAILSLDRAWIGNDESVNPFAKDITKSFISALFPDALDQEFKLELIQAIWNIKGRQDRVYCIDEAVYNWETANAQIKLFLEVFRGNQGIVSFSSEFFSLKMENRLEKHEEISPIPRLITTLKWRV